MRPRLQETFSLFQREVKLVRLQCRLPLSIEYHDRGIDTGNAHEEKGGDTSFVVAGKEM